MENVLESVRYGKGGWKNPVTLELDSWMLNNGDNLDRFYNMAIECWEDSEGKTEESRAKKASKALAQKIRETVEEEAPLKDTFWGYVIEEGLAHIDYSQVASTFIADVVRWEKSGADEDDLE